MFILQCNKLHEDISKLKELLANKDNADPEEIKKATSTLQQASLKLFELAYKKMASERDTSSTTENSNEDDQKKENKN